MKFDGSCCYDKGASRNDALQVAGGIYLFLVDLSVTTDETEFNERVVSHDCSWLSMDT